LSTHCEFLVDPAVAGASRTHRPWRQWSTKSTARWWLLGVLLTALVLALPGPVWHRPLREASRSINLALIRPQSTPRTPVTTKTKAEEKEQAAPVPEPKANTSSHKTKKQHQPITAAPQDRRQPETRKTPATRENPERMNASQLANILSQQTNYTGEVRISADFQTRTSTLDEYHPPAMLARQWSRPTPGLDMDVDAPETTMEFYDFGWQGKAERLFEKLVPKKTYVTRYGTRIECMRFLLMHMCGWGASEVNLSDQEQQRLDDLYASLHNRSLWENNENDNEKKTSSSEALTEANDPFSIKARLGPGPDPKPKFSNLHSRRWATEDQSD